MYREKYWIEKLRTYIGFKDCNGYNATLGEDGKSYLKLNEKEVIDYHINKAVYVVGRTAKHFNVDNSTIKNILLKNNIFWLKENDVNKLRAYEEYGGVIQVNVKHKIVENIFENVAVAALLLNKNVKSLAQACHGRKNGSHYAYGYLWYYGKDLPKIQNELKFIY